MTNDLALTFLLKLLAMICCWVAMRTNAAFHRSSMVSRSLKSSSRFCCYVIKPYLAVGTLISAGKTASHPYTKENGDCLVAVRGIIRFTRRIDVSASAHFPFFVVSRFFNMSMTGLLSHLK